MKAGSAQDWTLRNKYGIGSDEYNRLLLSQGNGCAICGEPQADARGRRLHVDHCHETGNVRGLLCLACNAGLGFFRDEPWKMRAAADYIEGSRYEISEVLPGQGDDLGGWREMGLGEYFLDQSIN